MFAIDGAVEAPLLNWGRWAAPRFGVSRRTHFMFRGAQSGSRGEILGMNAPVVPQAPVDVDQAWAMEKVICSTTFLPVWRQLLVAHYALGCNPTATCRSLSIRRDDYDHQIHDATYYAHGCLHQSAQPLSIATTR
ncbi:hypothetical protein [Roseateles sp. P5_E8]